MIEGTAEHVLAPDPARRIVQGETEDPRARHAQAPSDPTRGDDAPLARDPYLDPTPGDADDPGGRLPRGAGT